VLHAVERGLGVATLELALDGVSVVVKGLFNAAIFSPAWLLAEGLIGKSEYGEADVELITREVASFTVGWLRCQVTPDALQLTTTEPEEFERVRDAAVGILNTLSHTPVAALGINREVHLPARDGAHYLAIGDALAPKEFWEPLVDLPATRTLTIWGQRPDKRGGRVQIQIESSVRFRQHVFISHNDHFNLLKVDKQPASREEALLETVEPNLQPSAHKGAIATEILTSEWKSSMGRSTDVINAILRIK